MPSKPSRAALAVVVVLAVTVTAVGLVVFWPSDNQGTQQPIGYNASERLSDLDGYTATVETVMHIDNETNRTVQRVWMRPGTGEMRVETIEGTGSTLTVSNGSVTWLYDREANEVTTLNTSGYGTESDTQGERIERIFKRLNVSRDAVEGSTSATITPSGAPLPSVPGGGGHAGTSTSSPAVQAADEFGVHYEGTDTVDGRAVYVISIQPESEGNATVFEEYQQTMYVDTEWFLPLKTHIEWTSEDRSVEFTTTYRNVTFEPGIDDDRFEFEPPENATVVDSGLPSVRTYDSVGALRDAVSLPVPDPDIPSGFEFDVARHIPGEFRSVSLQYTAETAQLSVSVNNVTDAGINETDGQRLTVDGREVIYREFGTSRIVSWTCGEYSYSVTATAVTKDRLLDVAASIECG